MLEEGDQEDMQACLILSSLKLRLKVLVGPVTRVEKKKRHARTVDPRGRGGRESSSLTTYWYEST